MTLETTQEEEQGRRWAEFMVGLERVAIEAGWRWDGQRWVRESPTLQAGTESAD